MKREGDKMSMNLSNQAKFLLFSYFGITESDLNEKDKIITKCAQRAYLDLSRTLMFKDKYKEKEKDNKEEKQSKAAKRKEFRDKMCEIIQENVLCLISSDKYEEKHEKLCEKLKKKAEEYCYYEVNNDKKNGITYGQAQKWLNMTIKYMWLLEMWDDEFKKVINKIHVPVDSYIIEAVWEFEGVKLPIKDENREKDYKNPAEHVKAWSQWNKDEYTDFQDRLRAYLSEEKTTSPIEWEGPAWIEIAQKRNEQDDEKQIEKIDEYAK